MMTLSRTHSDTYHHCISATHHTIILRTKRMPKQRVFGRYGRDQDGKQTRTVHTPGSKTHVDTQTFFTTPNSHNEAWLPKLPDEEKARRNDNGQSIRDSRKKAKHENETGKRARVPFALRAESSGGGSAEGKKPRVLSRKVL